MCLNDDYIKTPTEVTKDFVVEQKAALNRQFSLGNSNCMKFSPVS